MRFYRFSLKHIFIVFALLAVASALVSSRLQQFRIQRLVVEELPGSPQAFFHESTRWLDWPLGLLESSEMLSDCTSLSYDFDATRLTTAEEAQLAEALAQLKQLVIVSFGENQVSTSCYDRLTAMGLRVDHWWLTDYRLTKK